MVRFVPFVVGFATSVGCSFAIIERIRDRRCLYLTSSKADDAVVTTYIYNSKLKNMLMEQETTTEPETYFAEQTRVASKFVRVAVNQCFKTAGEIANEAMKQIRGGKEEK